MDTAELEKVFSPFSWSLRGSAALAEQKYIEITAQGSIKATQSVKGRLDVSYGDSEAQKIDLFGEDDLPKDAPIFAFLHGGYWIQGCRQDSRHFVPALHDAGILCCSVGYDLISESITLPDIVSETQSAIEFLLKYADKRGSRGVYLCGYSAGAHLVTMALSAETDKLKLSHLIKGVISVCGLFDLKEILPTSNAPAARINEEIANRCSPLTAIPTLKSNLDPSTPVLIVSAEHDAPAFIKQSEKYHQALKKAGINSKLDLIKGEDHMTVIEKLCSADFVFTKKLIEFVKV